MPASVHEWAASATIDAEPVITATTDLATAMRTLAPRATSTVSRLSLPGTMPRRLVGGGLGRHAGFGHGHSLSPGGGRRAVSVGSGAACGACRGAGRPRDRAGRATSPGLEKAQLRRLRQPQPMHAVEPALEPLERGDLVVEPLPPVARDAVPVGLRGCPVVGEAGELVADLADGEAHVGRGADEGQPPQHAALEPSLAAGGAVGLDQALRLVVADGRRREAAATGDLAHREQVPGIHPSHPLNSSSLQL